MIFAELSVVPNKTAQNLHKTTKKIRIYREADVNTFEAHMKSTEMELCTMNNVESMWHKFSSSCRKAIEELVPIKKVDIKSSNQPIWFNK